MTGQSKDAARVQIKRHARKAALLAEHGDTCACGQPATCFARRSPERPTSRKRLDLGPSDRGLTSRMDLIARAMMGRVPVCSFCQHRRRNDSVTLRGPGTARNPARDVRAPGRVKETPSRAAGRPA